MSNVEYKIIIGIVLIEAYWNGQIMSTFKECSIPIPDAFYKLKLFKSIQHLLNCNQRNLKRFNNWESIWESSWNIEYMLQHFSILECQFCENYLCRSG